MPRKIFNQEIFERCLKREAAGQEEVTEICNSEKISTRTYYCWKGQEHETVFKVFYPRGYTQEQTGKLKKENEDLKKKVDNLQKWKDGLCQYVNWYLSDNIKQEILENLFDDYQLPIAEIVKSIELPRSTAYHRIKQSEDRMEEDE